MSKLTEFKRVEQVRFMPDELEYGVLYISKEFKTAVHLCPDGCGTEISIPLFDHPGAWDYKENGDKVTLSPSLENLACPNKAHYFIRDNKVQWCQ